MVPKNELITEERVLELIDKLIDIGRLELIGSFTEVMKNEATEEICSQIMQEITKEYFGQKEAIKSKLLLVPTDFEAISIACTQGFYFESFNELLKDFIKNISYKHTENSSMFYTPQNLKTVDIEEYISPRRNKNKVDRFSNEIKVHRTHFVSVIEFLIGLVPFLGNVYSVESTGKKIINDQKTINKKKLLYKTTESHVMNNDIETVALLNSLSTYMYEQRQNKVKNEFNNHKAYAMIDRENIKPYNIREFLEKH